MTSRTTVTISALTGFLAVALGAFGAHALKNTLIANGTEANWNTAALYHLTHAVGLVALALHDPARRLAWWLWLGGIIIFSGSLYVLAAFNLRFLGAITPIGGLLLLGGWLALLRTGNPKAAVRPS